MLPGVVADFCVRHALAGTRGVVALSGGADSVCLAILLRNLQSAGVIGNLVVAHLNHQLRGEESDADEAFVIEQCRQWGIACRTNRCAVARVAEETGANLEATARRLRYAWFEEIAVATAASWVATGHNADDQAETVLFRLLRGSGLQGLTGMAEVRALGAGVRLLRPLLTAWRADIRTYLELRHQDYRQDSSNQDLGFTRNRLRHELLPHLAAAYNPAIADILCRLAEQARDAQTVISVQANELLLKVELPRAGALVILDVAGLQALARPWRREVFRLLWQREAWPLGQLNFETWDRLAELVEQKRGALDLPGGARAASPVACYSSPERNRIPAGTIVPAGAEP